MTHNEFENVSLLEVITSNTNDEEYSIPLDISDIINICKDFSNLGYNIQNQIDAILEVGIEEAIKSGSVKQESLPKIRYFLQKIIDNPYFGDAAYQAKECLHLIDTYKYTLKIKDVNVN